VSTGSDAFHHLWAELPNGRWVLRVIDDHWYQADPDGAVILSPMGIRQANTLSLDEAKRTAERMYRESLVAMKRRGERDVLTANAGLAALGRERNAA